MGIDLSVVKETIEINKEELKGNKELTNELLIDDIMLALGYNKKRNLGVRRVYGSNIDWEINIGDKKRFVVKTIGYGEGTLDADRLTQEEVGEYELAIITNGYTLAIYDYSIDDTKEIIGINITNESKDIDEVLSYLSYENYSYEGLIEVYRRSLLTESKVIELIESNIEDLSIFILKQCGYDETDTNLDLVQKVILGNVERLDTTEEFENTETTDTNLEVERLNSEIAIKQAEIDRLQDTLNNKLDTVVELENENIINKGIIEELTNKLETVPINNNGVSADLVKEFRNKVIELENDKAKLSIEADHLREEIQKLKNSGEEQEREITIAAKSLLDAIPDNDEAERAYVAVINTKLFQHHDIHRFIGTCIEELYDIVGFKIMPVLFDGDVFKLIQQPIRRDFTINNKSYDLDLDSLSEEIVISKLIDLFNKFKEVIISCKMVGTNKNSVETEKVKENRLLSVSLSDIAKVVWSDDIDVIDIEHVSYKEDTGYNMTKIVSTSDDYYSILLSKVIDSMISFSDNLDEGIVNLRKMDMTKVSKYLKLVNAENRKNPRISFTKFIVENIDSIDKYIPILNEVAEILKIDKASLNVYLRVDIKEDSEYVKYCVEDTEIRGLGDVLEYTHDSTNDKFRYAIIQGGITDNILLNRKSLSVQSDVINKCVMAKTNDIEAKLEDKDDIANLFTRMISMANNFNPVAVGNVMDSEYRIISSQVEEVSNKYIEVNIKGDTYYISEMEEWQLVYALIKLNAVIFKNKLIALKVRIDEKAYDFYANEHTECEPSNQLAVKSFVNYLSDRLK